MEAAKIKPAINPPRGKKPDGLELQRTKKNIIHKVRNTLQKLFLSDNRETIVRWEIFQEVLNLLEDKNIEDKMLQEIIEKYGQSIRQWREMYESVIFLVRVDADQALTALKQKKTSEELLKMGENIEKLLDEITTEINHWEMKNSMY